MKLIIAGSGGITDYNLLRQAIVDSGFWKGYKHTLEIVSGCARGVDSLAIEFAQKNNLVLHKFPADWSTHGKKAGHVRNIQMAEFADGLLALWDGVSPGTKHMIDQARKRSLIVYVEIIKK